jgi:hypothetical protein
VPGANATQELQQSLRLASTAADGSVAAIVFRVVLYGIDIRTLRDEESHDVEVPQEHA